MESSIACFGLIYVELSIKQTLILSILIRSEILKNKYSWKGLKNCSWIIQEYSLSCLRTKVLKQFLNY